MTELVCITKSGERYHAIPEGRRLKHAACGAFDQTELVQISREWAKTRGYSACINCYRGERVDV